MELSAKMKREKREELFMKKSLIVLLVVIVLSLCGCNNDDQKAESTSEVQPFTLSDEELYTQLSKAISSPMSIWIIGSHTFTAAIISEPFELEVTVDGEDVVGLYQAAQISRNVNDIFVLDVTDLQEYPQEGSLASITGILDGAIYWNEEIITSVGSTLSNQIQVTVIKAKSFEPYHPIQTATNTEPVINAAALDASGTIKFTGSHFSEDNFGKIVVVYLYFTNTGSTETEPLMSRLLFSLGEHDDFLRPTTYAPKEVDGNALSAYPVAGSSRARTDADATDLYYGAFRVDQDSDDTVLYINRFDDDFNWTDSIALEIAQSLEEMKSP
jgi:hypothetical protein